jgi:L-ornithine N5-monooxygenase
MVTVSHQEVEILAIGAGPANLALAVAVEELAPAEIASNTLVIERCESVAWQRGMLLPWAKSQVSFLKDLVTRRNPQSRFTFVNYLHSVGRLDDFINMDSCTPFRLELSDYLQWVAKSLERVQVEYGRSCVSIKAARPRGAGPATSWLVRTADGATITARDLIIGTGRGARIPAVFAGLPEEKVIHSTEYTRRITDFSPADPLRVAVVGGAESAAEMLWETYQRFPNSQCTMIMRSIGLDYYQKSPFTNELYFPSYTDRFFGASASAREQVLRAMHSTNYSAVSAETLDALFQQIYLERLTGARRLSMTTMADVEAAEVADGEIALTLRDRMNGYQDELRCDLVLLGTGFEPGVPGLVRHLADACGIGKIQVSRNYRMSTPPDITAGCYLQGTNETTHGIADSLISVLASRAAEISADLLAHREKPTGRLTRREKPKAFEAA